MTTFPFPDDAIPDAGADVLGAPAPGGTSMYGGADLAAYTDAHGYLYVPYCGDRSGRKFGTHCFRITPQGAPEWVELPAFTEGRAGVSLQPSGLWLSWPDPGGRTFTHLRVPGFVTPGFPSSGQSAPAPAPIPSVPPAGSVSTVDAEGRAYTTSVKKELEAKLAALSARVGGGGGLTGAQVKDHIWAFAPVALYSRLEADDAGLVGQIRRIVGPAAAPAIDDARIEALIRKVLRELLEA